MQWKIQIADFRVFRQTAVVGVQDAWSRGGECAGAARNEDDECLKNVIFGTNFKK